MRRLLRMKHLFPETIISSSAITARATAEAFAKVLGYKGEIISNSSLYAAEPEAYIGALHEISDVYARAQGIKIGDADSKELTDKFSRWNLSLHFF